MFRYALYTKSDDLAYCRKTIISWSRISQLYFNNLTANFKFRQCQISIMFFVSRPFQCVTSAFDLQEAQRMASNMAILPLFRRGNYQKRYFGSTIFHQISDKNFCWGAFRYILATFSNGPYRDTHGTPKMVNKNRCLLN